MNDCKTCGRPVRLGGHKISINRRRGVAHYVAHMDGSPMHEEGWNSVALKPYPKEENEKPWRQLVRRWNEQNPPR